MLEKGHVEEVLVVNSSIVRVTIGDEFLKEEPHRGLLKNSNSIFGNKKNGPHYQFEALSADKLQEKLDKWEEKYDLKYDTTREENYGRDIASWLIFFGIMIAIWIFIMRRVTGGGGGAGGQIFNIGKSKAQVFGQGKSTNVSFKDVAGLEGAKEEIQEIVEFLKSPKKIYKSRGQNS